MYDDDGFFNDADIEQAEMEAIGNRIARLERRGICTHSAWVGFAINPDTGRVWYPEQEGLVGDQVRCRGCHRVFPDDEAIHRAHQEVVG